jgi:hypothetical protein
MVLLRHAYANCDSDNNEYYQSGNGADSLSEDVIEFARQRREELTIHLDLLLLFGTTLGFEPPGVFTAA